MRLGFGGCVFDSDTREILRGARAISLSPKAFLLLEILIRDSPKAVSKESIHKELWPDTFVSEANLPNLVAELRAALGDDAKKPRIVRTVHRFGYAFRAKTRPAPEDGVPAGAAYRLVSGENLLGRERGAVVWIDEESVSRRHARILVDDQGASLEDLGSKNGTSLRGKKIRKLSALRDKDVIKVGPASLVFRAFQRSGSTASTIGERARR
jgi:DNA-binding winged helix-turn-helix (wHTH) protein